MYSTMLCMVLKVAHICQCCDIFFTKFFLFFFSYGQLTNFLFDLNYCLFFFLYGCKPSSYLNCEHYEQY